MLQFTVEQAAIATPSAAIHERILPTGSFDAFAESRNMEPTIACLRAYQLAVAVEASLDEIGIVPGVLARSTPAPELTFAFPEDNSAGAAWLFDLLVAIKFGDVSVENVQSYFASVNALPTSAGLCLKVVKYASTVLNPAMTPAFISAMVNKSEWLKYRLTYSATPSLIIKASDAMGVYGPAMFGAAEMVVVRDALSNPFDKMRNALITDRTKALARVVLSVFGMLPADWYQGSKANASAALLTSARVLATRILRNSQELAENATDQDLLAAGLLVALPNTQV